MLSFMMKTKLPHLYDKIVSCCFLTVTNLIKCYPFLIVFGDT